MSDQKVEKRIFIRDGFIVMVSDEQDTYDVNFVPFNVNTDNFVTLKFQNGSIPERGHNGLTNEILMEILIDRMRRLNSNMPNDHTKHAIYHVHQALDHLNQRSLERRVRGIEGTKFE